MGKGRMKSVVGMLNEFYMREAKVLGLLLNIVSQQLNMEPIWKRRTPSCLA